MLSEDQVQRYARQIVLPEIGPSGQAALSAASVLCVGAGGLGSPAALYLAAAGVGTLGIVDADSVALSNLHRQILHDSSDVGRPKALSAQAKLAALNPDVTVRAHRQRLESDNAVELLSGYDVVVDGSDNFETRYLVNDACVLLKRPLVSGAVVRFEGLMTTVLPGRGPCYRCAFPEPPEADCGGSCADAGIVGAVAGVVGSWQALEAVKIVTGLPGLAAGRMLMFDFMRGSMRERPVSKRPDCAACAGTPSVRPMLDSHTDMRRAS